VDSRGAHRRMVSRIRDVVCEMYEMSECSQEKRLSEISGQSNEKARRG